MKHLLQRRGIQTTLATLALLAGMALHLGLRSSNTASDEYHRRVAAAIDAVPHRVADFVSQEAPPPTPAVRLMRPNRVLFRRYTGPPGPRAVELLIVHSRDARDMIGHHPPVSYPARGWSATREEPKMYTVGGMRIPATRYRFEMSAPTFTRTVDIVSVLIRPDGAFPRDVEALRRGEAGAAAHDRGAAQVQLVFRESLPEPQRRELVEQFLAACVPVFESIRSRTDATAPASASPDADLTP